MITSTIVLFIAVFLVYLHGKEKNNNYFYFSLLLVCLVYSFRYGYGNDYFSYERIFKYAGKAKDLNKAIEIDDIEVGWIALCRFLYPLGYRFFILATTVFLCASYYRLIFINVPIKTRWIAVFIFLLHPDLFLLDLSMIRQGLAGLLFFYAFLYSMNNKLAQTIICASVAVSFHSSVLLVLPLLILAFFYRKLNIRFLILALISVIVFFYLKPDYLQTMIMDVVSSGEVNDRYINYFKAEEGISVGIGVLLQFLAIVPMYISYKKHSQEAQFILLIYSLIFVVIMFSTQIPMLLRYNGYPLPLALLLFPQMHSDVQLTNSNKDCKSMLKYRRYEKIGLYIMLLYVVYSFFTFFSSETYGKYYSDFSFGI